MVNCDICEILVYEKSLIFTDDKFLCLNCDSNYENEEEN